MSYSSSSNRCGSCGGSSYRPPASSTPTYDRCAGGLSMTARPQEKSPSKNYNKEDCPTFAISCESKQVFRDCAKTALCEFLRCVTETLCPDGKFELETLRDNKKLGEELINCVGQLACSFMHCVPDALCPEPLETPTPIDCLPCGYAVEVLQ